MDTVIWIRLIWLGSIIALVALVLGVEAGLLALQARRERRRARLRAAVLAALGPLPAQRAADISVEFPPLARPVVRITGRGWSADEIWRATRRLSGTRGHPRVVIEGLGNPDDPVSLAIRTREHENPAARRLAA
jgi:hypothetical protein